MNTAKPLISSFRDLPLLAPFGSDRFCVKFCAGLWMAFFVVMTVIGVLEPQRPIWHVYYDSAERWWSGQPVYGDGPHGFLYMPTSILFITPFYVMPKWLALHLWRLAHFSLLTVAFYRFVRLYAQEHWPTALLAVMLFVIPTASINLLRTQVEMPMFALFLLGAADIAERKWKRAGIIMAVAFALKPLALVPVIFFGAAYPRILRSCAITFAILLGLSFVYPDPHYVWDQYLALPGKLAVAGSGHVHGKWFDLSTGLAQFGILIPPLAMKAVSTLVAMAIMVGSLVWAKRLPPPQAAMAILTASVCYLLLLNPRVEEGSYMNLATLSALQSMLTLRQGRTRTSLFYLMMTFLLDVHWIGNTIYRSCGLWLKQAICLTLAVPLLKDAKFALTERGEAPRTS